jgi:ribonuclease R
VIKALLSSKTYKFEPSAETAEPPQRRGSRPALKNARPLPRVGSKDLAAWEVAGAHTSARERRADEASRDVEAWLKCKYMREHLGEEFSGTVSSVAAFGLFVTLDGMYVEGLVHITELGGEYYRFDEVRQDLRGERSGMRYAVGTRVRVQVSRVDLDGRRIDFRLVREGEDDRPLVRAKADRVKPETAVDELAAIKSADREGKAVLKRERKTAARSIPGIAGRRGAVPERIAPVTKKSRR